MEIVRKADAHWNGDIKEGSGNVKLGSGAFSGPYSFKARTGDSQHTNPEELIGAAHAGCFTMALSAMLSKSGNPPKDISTTAKVHLASEGEGFVISLIELETKASVPGLSEDEFIKIAENAKTNCPVSKALSAVKIDFKATLLQG